MAGKVGLLFLAVILLITILTPSLHRMDSKLPESGSGGIQYSPWMDSDQDGYLPSTHGRRTEESREKPSDNFQTQDISEPAEEGHPTAGLSDGAPQKGTKQEKNLSEKPSGKTGSSSRMRDILKEESKRSSGHEDLRQNPKSKAPAYEDSHLAELGYLESSVSLSDDIDHKKDQVFHPDRRIPNVSTQTEIKDPRAKAGEIESLKAVFNKIADDMKSRKENLEGYLETKERELDEISDKVAVKEGGLKDYEKNVWNVSEGDRVNIPRPGVQPEKDHFWSFLPRFGFGLLDYQPESWKGISLESPVYFKNTYVGGNARLKYYSTFLSQNRTYSSHIERLTSLSTLHPQPYDPPEKGAMALYAHLDQTHLKEPGRIFLQIGLKGTDQFTWRRPPVTIVILDLLSGARKEEGDLYLETLLSRLDYYDHISLIRKNRYVALTSPEVFIHETPSIDDAQLSTNSHLWEKVRAAFSSSDQFEIIQNKRLIVLTDNIIDRQYEDQIHNLLMQEVNTSIVSWSLEHLSTQVDAAQSGDGNLYYVENRDEIEQLATEELRSLEKVVARALRLSIQLAPGVRLIQVIGSTPLSWYDKERVKEAEKAVDRRIARTLGIESDRGDDDPGLQTVIPYFFGGDEHIIIVELEVDKPGPIADVKLRFKDMVDMKNATLRAAVALSKRPIPSTPHQQAVVKNLLSISTALLLQKLQESSFTHNQKLQLIEGYLTHHNALPPPFSSDPFIVQDNQLLQECRLLFSKSTTGNEVALQDAIRFAEINKNISQYRK